MQVLYNFGFGVEERDALTNILSTDKFLTDRPGEQVASLEKEFCDYVGTKFAVAMSSGTAGIQCALVASGVRPGDEVITVANTHESPPMCIINLGAKPVLVDAELDTLDIDPNLIESKITSKTKAIIPVHSCGHPYDVDAVHEIARKHGLAIVEDSAQSLGAKYKGKLLGSIGDSNCAVYSFARHKHIMCGGWGGVVVTNRREVADAVSALARQGRGEAFFREYGARKQHQVDRRANMERSGYSFYLNELSASIARIQFKKFRTGPLSVEKRRAIAKKYNEILKPIRAVTPPVEKEWAYHSYLRYCIRAKDRDRLYTYLSKMTIQLEIHYPTPVYRQKYFEKMFGPVKDSYPVTEQLSSEVLTLPCWPQVTDEQISYVTDGIKQFYTN